MCLELKASTLFEIFLFFRVLHGSTKTELKRMCLCLQSKLYFNLYIMCRDVCFNVKGVVNAGKDSELELESKQHPGMCRCITKASAILFIDLRSISDHLERKMGL